MLVRRICWPTETMLGSQHEDPGDVYSQTTIDIDCTDTRVLLYTTNTSKYKLHTTRCQKDRITVLCSREKLPLGEFKVTHVTSFRPNSPSGANHRRHYCTFF